MITDKGPQTYATGLVPGRTYPRLAAAAKHAAQQLGGAGHGFLADVGSFLGDELEQAIHGFGGSVLVQIGLHFRAGL